jgi:hypothetical protein
MLKTDKTTYISVDVECTGPVPGLYSMISLGAAAFEREGRLLDKLLINFRELPDSKQDTATMQFWQENPIAYMRTKENPVTAEAGTKTFYDWYKKMEHPVFVFMPQKFDGLFVYWYLQTFVEGLGFINTPDAIDVKTLAMAALGLEDPQRASKKYWPKVWKDKKIRHSHIASEDACEQGSQFIKILNHLEEMRK